MRLFAYFKGYLPNYEEMTKILRIVFVYGDARIIEFSSLPTILVVYNR